MKTLKLSLLAFALIIYINEATAFCGFYVAKADAKLFNNASQVIIVRDGSKTVVTMSSDFKGNVKDFAMVVPVPEVILEENIRVTERVIFDKLDAYSAPRLVEYYDQNPCHQYKYRALMSKSISAREEVDSMSDEAISYGVTIEAKYTIGEYDILILSAKESDGLKSWLKLNGYKIPATANEVLDPYIRNNIKFFVAKVNLKAHQQSGYTDLRPLQMAFNTDKFMLPIRLGMANSNGNQDLIIYAFTKTGRVETVNYRTVKLPSNRNIPFFVKNNFQNFYKDMFTRAWSEEGSNVVMLEYAWDISSSNFVKCDPCVSTPPDYSDLREAGVFWVKSKNGGRWGGANYNGNVHFTRLHVRYNRRNFPQDLFFMHTPNKSTFQGRYIITHHIKDNLNCEGANDYIKNVV